MSWKDRKRNGAAAGFISLDFKAIERVMAELGEWAPSHIDAPVRFSSVKQQEGTSEARQVANIESIIQKYWPGIKPNWLRDLATSAFKYSAKTGLPHCLDEDKELGKYVARARRGGVPAGTLMIVDNLDRFSRAKIDDSFDAGMTLLRHGITILVLHPRPLLLRPEDRNNPEKRDAFESELNRAHNESATRSKYVLSSVEERIKAALAGEQVSFGGYVPNWVQWNTQLERYVPNEKLFPIIERICNEAARHKVLFQIIQDLNDEHQPTLQNAKCWQPCTLYDVLRNEALLGTLIIKGVRIENYLPPVIKDKSKWDAIQARLGIKQKKGGGGKANSLIQSLFPGRVFCYHCGLPMRSSSHPGYFESRIYICTGHRDHCTKTGTVCDQTRNIMIKAIELDLFGMILTKLPSEILDPNRDVERRAQQTEIQAQIGRLEKQLRKAEQYHIENDDESRDAELKKRADDINAEIKGLRARIAELAAEIGPETAWADVVKILTGQKPGTLKEVKEAVALLQAQLSDQEKRRKLIGPLKMVVAGIEIDMRCSTLGRLDPAGEMLARYRVTLVGGAVLDWSDITILYKDLVRANFAAAVTEDRELRRLARWKATRAAKPSTPEQEQRRFEAISKALRTPERRAAMRDRMLRRWENVRKEKELLKKDAQQQTTLPPRAEGNPSK